MRIKTSCAVLVAMLSFGWVPAAFAQDSIASWKLARFHRHVGWNECDIVQRPYTYVNCCGELIASPDDPRSAPGGAQ